MVMQSIFPQRGNFPVTYNYVDIARGTGIINFYLGSQSVLTEDSQLVSSGYQGSDGTFTWNTPPFKFPRIIDGIPYASFSLAAYVKAAGTGNQTIAITATKLIHVHAAGGTTDLTNTVAAGSCVESATGEALEQKNNMIAWNTISNVRILKGDQIRLSVTIDVTTDSDGSARLLTDPSNSSRIWTYTTATLTIKNTRSLISLPFKLDFL